MKFLLWALIIGAIALYVLNARRSAGPGRRRDSEEAAEPMVRCARCGLYLPDSEALPGSGGRRYCSDAHRRLDGGG